VKNKRMVRHLRTRGDQGQSLSSNADSDARCGPPLFGEPAHHTLPRLDGREYENPTLSPSSSDFGYDGNAGTLPIINPKRLIPARISSPLCTFVLCAANVLRNVPFAGCRGRGRGMVPSDPDRLRVPPRRNSSGTRTWPSRPQQDHPANLELLAIQCAVDADEHRPRRLAATCAAVRYTSSAPRSASRLRDESARQES